ncbi:MAG: hypothetical protein ABR584_02265 [Candidatus Baltobacteraceae bacterium]
MKFIIWAKLRLGISAVLSVDGMCRIAAGARSGRLAAAIEIGTPPWEGWVSG